jgi:hypothetical protein
MEATSDRAADASVATPSIEHPPKPTAALTPPTSEELNDAKNEPQEDSELSDLDLDDDDDDMEDIKPDREWMMNETTYNSANAPVQTTGTKRTADESLYSSLPCSNSQASRSLWIASTHMA